MPPKNNSSSTSNLLDDSTYNDINNLYQKMKPGDEFEFMVFNFNRKYLSFEKYITLLKYLTRVSKSKKTDMKIGNSLDINYTDADKETNYRITLDGIEDINTTIQPFHKYENHVTFRVLATKSKEKDSNIVLMKKVKDKELSYDATDINVRVRLAEESQVSKTEFNTIQNLSHEVAKNIIFRLKQRATFYVYGDMKSRDFIKIDLTMTKMSRNINRINYSIPNYELEIELGIASEQSKKSTNFLNIMLKELEVLLKIIQQSNFVITNSKEREVLQEYSNIFGLNVDNIMYLESRQPQSLEIQHVTEMLPNRYAVTDKADGDRFFLIICKNRVYLISTNLNVKDTGIELPQSLSKYNNSVMDGEYIFIASKNRHLMMIFDCLFIGGKDVRKIADFMTRLSHADEIISNCFILEKQKGFVIQDYSSKSAFNLNDIAKFHEQQIKKFIDTLNSDSEIAKKYPLIRRKYFIACTGAKSWEIFKYSSIIWNKYTTDPEIKVPYILDGLIYHPINQEYVVGRDSKFIEYKWKPPTKNSIDFYVRFQRDKGTGKILTVYDNSIDDYVRNKPYKICHLHCGYKKGKEEEPILFRSEEDGYEAFIFLKDGEAVDQDGNLISDNTVVEFYYDNRPDLDDRFRWMPIRTRYDKTESVQKYNRRYGNYIDVALKVWRSITNPILIEDIDDLAKGNDEVKGVYYYDKKIESLRSKIGHELIISTAKEDAYFQIRTNLAKPMKQFHNWVKSVLIYTHMHPMYQNDKSLTVLDLACGQGSDLMRFYYSKVANYVGIDIDKNALHSAVNGAVSRYNQFRKKYPAYPPMTFIQADVGSLLNYEDQFRALGGMSKDNKDLMEKYFSSNPNKQIKFDRVNCQFAMHYFLKNNETWTNFKHNLNACLKPGGYYIASTFDATGYLNLLKTDDIFTSYYTTDKGDKKKLFEFVKKFGKLDKDTKIGPGYAIEVFLAWIFKEGTYQTEYLVDLDFVESELLRDCDLELVDTDTYGNLFEIHRDFFVNFSQYEENVAETGKFFRGAKEYYENNEINNGCLIHTKLARYYVFRKKEITSEKKDKVQKGGSKDVLDLSDESRFILPVIKEKENSYCNSIYNILRTHNIIPKSLSATDLFNEFKLDIKPDSQVDYEYINKINNSFEIYHQQEGGSETGLGKKVLDGCHTFVLEKDCNNEYEIDYIKKNKTKKYDNAIILFKNNGTYQPVYRVETNNKKRGIFSLEDPLITNLISQI